MEYPLTAGSTLQQLKILPCLMYYKTQMTKHNFCLLVLVISEKNNDAGVFKKLNFRKLLISRNLDNPSPRKLWYGWSTSTEDESDEMPLSKRMWRAKQITGCAFGIHTKKSGIFTTEMLPLVKAHLIMVAACVFCNTNTEHEGNMSDVHASARPSKLTLNVWLQYLDYYHSNSGSIPLQKN